MISHCTSSGSWSVNLPSSLCCGPSHLRPPPNPRPVFPLPHPSSHNLPPSSSLTPSNAASCPRIFAFAVPFCRKCFSSAYHLDDSFTSFRSWLRCHLLTEAIPDHLGGVKMAVKSVSLPPSPLPWEVELISPALESELGHVVALISQMQQKWCCASSGPGF